MSDYFLQTNRIDSLIAAARSAMTKACCGYSGFPVGAALLDADGGVHVGVNVESSSYGGTICAERAALARALADGAHDFVAIAVTTDAAIPVMPCGICRQLLHDYAPDILVVAESGGRVEKRRISELLPDAFGGDLLRSPGPGNEKGGGT